MSASTTDAANPVASDRFDGRVAMVTGGAMGIGAAIAELLAERGAQVVVVDREEPKEPLGDPHLAVRADVSKPEDVERAVAATLAHAGRLDVLVCSAGIQRYGDAPGTSLETWREVIDVNLSSMYYAAHFAVPYLLKQPGSAVVNISSVQAFAAQRGVLAYSASKGGINALTRAMAVDHAPHLRVNAIAPGSVDTPMLQEAAKRFTPGDSTPAETVAGWGRMHPIGRPATPREIAEVACFLASERAAFITGATVTVDGGLLSQLGGT
ncbi:MAG: hypothetical protein QOK42_632 [Frankiaceae bacterium]|jgi:NAD(P)-dependent dehydrogenase (short-subunit alcohol dehydrogenase family)|nr:hypothetical protein [Frankiaceae bacterium]